MPIAGTDLLVKFSVTTGSAGNTTSQANQNNSLGKYISTSQWAGGVLHDLFDAITGDENAALQADYRCIFIHNNHATITWLNPVVWISTGGSTATIALGLDPAGVTAIGSSSAQAAVIANDYTAPTGVSFSSPTTKATGLSIGNIAPGNCAAIWIRRTAVNSAAVNNDTSTFTMEGDTTA